MRIYLDHNAATPVDPRVLQRFLRVERSCHGNPSSLHAGGRQARHSVERARAEAAAALGVAPEQVVFVSGGSEANNLAVAGAGDPARPVLLAPLEHPSVLAAAERRGARWWGVDAHARARVADSAADAGLLCLVHAQGEVGSIQPLHEARALADRLGVPLHIDASQTLGRMDLAAAVQCADTLTLSTHKVGGLRGASVLVVREPSALRPLVIGGNQERGLRAGTVSPSLAAATSLAVRLAVEEWSMRAERMRAARAAFAAALGTDLPGRCLTPEHSVPNTSMYLFRGVDGRNLLPALDMAGVEASQGSACSSGAPSPPRVLAAMGLCEHDARACVRFSFSHTTSTDEAARAGEVTRGVVQRLLTASALAQR